MLVFSYLRRNCKVDQHEADASRVPEMPLGDLNSLEVKQRNSFALGCGSRRFPSYVVLSVSVRSLKTNALYA